VSGSSVVAVGVDGDEVTTSVPVSAIAHVAGQVVQHLDRVRSVVVTETHLHGGRVLTHRR